MTLFENQVLFAQDIARLIKYVSDHGMLCVISETFKTPEEARISAYRNTGRLNGCVSRSISVDLGIFTKDSLPAIDIQRFGCFWESLDDANTWGGDTQRTIFKRRIKS